MLLYEEGGMTGATWRSISRLTGMQDMQKQELALEEWNTLLE